MLSFRVYDDEGPAREWPLVNAHLLERDDVAVPADITFAEGIISCRARSTDAKALCLRCDAGAMGRLMLQTCLLPAREEPYVLALELARHRIKMFIAKSEEWQMFELGGEHPAMRLWERARVLFTKAINETDPVEADRSARQSLVDAIDASERLAMAHAEILLHRRFGVRAASSTTLGVSLWPGRSSESLRTLVAKEFDVLMLPVNWNEIEVDEGRFNWDPLDRWMSWAQSQNKPVMAGPLLDFSRRALPRWMYVWQHDFDTCRDLVYDHIERVVQRYRSVVAMWSLGAGVNVNEDFEFKPAQMIDLLRMASLLVRQSRKGVRTMIELSQPFGEHAARSRDSLAPMAFVDRLLQEGIQFDCLGVQLSFGESGSGRCTRDLMQISTLLDRFVTLELPVMVTAMGVPSEKVDEDGGWWHERWSETIQSQWLARLCPIALSKPFVEAIFWSDFFDNPHSCVPGAGLIAEDGSPKQSLARLTGIRRRLRKPLGPMKALTRAGGEDEPPC